MVETMGAEAGLTRHVASCWAGVAASGALPVKSMLGESLQWPLRLTDGGAAVTAAGPSADHATPGGQCQRTRLWSEFARLRARYLRNRGEALPRPVAITAGGVSPTDNSESPDLLKAQARIWPGGSPACLGAR